MKRRKPIAKWRVWRQSLWPICLGQGRSEKTPIWVWGDLKLARDVCRMLNKRHKP